MARPPPPPPPMMGGGSGANSSTPAGGGGVRGGGGGGGGGSNVPPPPPQQQQQQGMGGGGLMNGGGGGGKAILRPRPDVAGGGRSGGGGGDDGVQQHSLVQFDGGASGEMSKVRLTPRGGVGGGGGLRRGEEEMKLGDDVRVFASLQDQMYFVKAGVGSGAIQREKLTAEQRMERPVSEWREKMSIEEQMLDYRQLWKRFGYTNRYKQNSR